MTKKKRKIRVRRHRRRTKKSGLTIVQSHLRSIPIKLKRPTFLNEDNKICNPNDIKKNCWKCKRELDYEDFLVANEPKQKEELDYIWFSPTTELYCCSCFNRTSKMIKWSEGKSIMNEISRDYNIDYNKDFLSSANLGLFEEEDKKKLLNLKENKESLILLKNRYNEIIESGKIESFRDLDRLLRFNENLSIFTGIELIEKIDVLLKIKDYLIVNDIIKQDFFHFNFVNDELIPVLYKFKNYEKITKLLDSLSPFLSIRRNEFVYIPRWEDELTRFNWFKEDHPENFKKIKEIAFNFPDLSININSKDLSSLGFMVTLLPNHIPDNIDHFKAWAKANRYNIYYVSGYYEALKEYLRN
jgi:hypothetical protein